jgi:hypothetical protein
MISEETEYDIMNDDNCSLLVKNMIHAIQKKYIHEMKRSDSMSDEEKKRCNSNSTSNSTSKSNSSNDLKSIFKTDSEDESKKTPKWSPPKHHGLSNSEIIIPQYYMENHSSFINIDYYDIIVDDIRNMRKLNKYQMEYIKKLDEDKKNYLFDIFNQVLESVACWH